MSDDDDDDASFRHAFSGLNSRFFRKQNTEVGCHCLIDCFCVKMRTKKSLRERLAGETLGERETKKGPSDGCDRSLEKIKKTCSFASKKKDSPVAALASASWSELKLDQNETKQNETEEDL